MKRYKAVSIDIYAFLWGALEYRSDFTKNFGDHQEAYEWGREWAHRITFRQFEVEA
jgi:hypothetical protein